MTLVSKLSLQLKQQENKKQAKLYSTTMYTSAARVEAERAGVAVKGQGAVKQRTSVLLGTRGAGGPQRDRRKRRNEKLSTSHTNTDRSRSHFLTHIGPRARRSPRISSFLPVLLDSLFMASRCKSDPWKALGYLDTTLCVYPSLTVAVVAAAVLHLSPKSCAGLLSTRMRPSLCILTPQQHPSNHSTHVHTRAVDLRTGDHFVSC